MKKRLDSYKGKLTVDQIAEGINAAKKNAKRLFEDANLLLEAGRFPSAAALAILSIEEAGKVSILRELALAKTTGDVNEAWNHYRSHTKKNATWLLPQFAQQGARKLEDFKALFDESSDHPYILDQVKQIAFYTDCLGKAHWSLPQDVIDESLAKTLTQIASIFAKDKNVTKTEIDLWIKHIGPVWNQAPSWMNHALCNWYRAMQEAGLAPLGENEIEKFIKRGI
ncbi:MAG: AbiV family abortive infection protein [Deltaproteobacteria bacterium]|nr:AbiV family abortive infection protein [Deltaproteobacteria bacterium]